MQAQLGYRKKTYINLYTRATKKKYLRYITTVGSDTKLNIIVQKKKWR